MKNIQIFSWKNINKLENQKIMSQLVLRTRYGKFCKRKIKTIQSELSAYKEVDLEENLGRIARVDEKDCKYYPYIYDRMLNDLSKALANDTTSLAVIAKVRDNFYRAERRYQDQVLLFFVEEMQIQLLLFLNDNTTNFAAIIKLYSNLITDSYTFQILLSELQSTINEAKSFKHFKNQRHIDDIIQVIENYKAADLAKNTSHNLIRYFPYIKTKQTKFSLLILATLMISCLSSSVSASKYHDAPFEGEYDPILIDSEEISAEEKFAINEASKANFQNICKPALSILPEDVAKNTENIKSLWNSCYVHAEQYNLVAEQKYFLDRLLELDPMQIGYLLRRLSIAESNLDNDCMINLAPRLLKMKEYKTFGSALLLIAHFNLNDYDKVIEYGKEVMRGQEFSAQSCYARALLQYAMGLREGYTYLVHHFNLQVFNSYLENAKRLAESNSNTGLLNQIRIFENNVYQFDSNGEQSIVYRLPLNENSIRTYNCLNESEYRFSKDELFDYYRNNYGLLLVLDDYQFSNPDHKATVFYDSILDRPEFYETYLEDSTFVVFKKMEDRQLARARVLNFDTLHPSVGAVISPRGEILQKQRFFSNSFTSALPFVLVGGLFMMLSVIVLYLRENIVKFGQEKRRKSLARQEHQRLKDLYIRKVNDLIHRFAEGELEHTNSMITIRTRNHITTLDLTHIDCQNPYSLRTITVDPKEIDRVLNEELKKSLQSFSSNNILVIPYQDPLFKNNTVKFFSNLDSLINELFKKICNHLIKVSPEHDAKEKEVAERQSQKEFKLAFQKKYSDYQKQILQLDPLQSSITRQEKSIAGLTSEKSDYTPYHLPSCLAVVSLIDKITAKIQTLQPSFSAIKKLVSEQKIEQMLEISTNKPDKNQAKINFMESKLQELKGSMQGLDTRIAEIQDLQETLQTLTKKAKLDIQESLRKEREAARLQEEQIRLAEERRENARLKEEEDERQKQEQKERLRLLKIEKQKARQAQLEAKQQQEKKRQEEAQRQELEKFYTRIRTDVRLIVALDCLDILSNALDQNDRDETNLLSYKCKEIQIEYKLMISAEQLLQSIVIESILYSLMKMSHAIGQFFSYEVYNLRGIIDVRQLYAVRNNIMHRRHFFANRSQLIRTFATECRNLLQEPLSQLRKTGVIEKKIDLSLIKTEFMLNNLDASPVDRESCLNQIANAAESLYQFYLVALSLSSKHFTLYSNNNVLLTAMRSCVIVIGEYLNSLRGIDKTTYHFLCNSLFKNEFLHITVNKDNKTFRNNIYSYYRDMIGHHFSDQDTNNNTYKHVAGSGSYIFEEILPQSLLNLAKASEIFMQTTSSLRTVPTAKNQANVPTQITPKLSSNLNPNAAPFVFNPTEVRTLAMVSNNNMNTNNETNNFGEVKLSFLIPKDELEKGEVLGRGGFGIVYKGKWQYKTVAIKELTTVTTETEQEFAHEMGMMASLRYPHVVQLFGVCLETKPNSLVMEYMANGSLYGMLHSNIVMNEKMCEAITLDIAMGLAYLHRNKIIHCDIKSMNILLDEHFKAKITDFGFAKVKITSNTNLLVGTCAWMAPELLGSYSPSYSTKSDIYSYGMVVWEIVSRDIPFKAAAGDYQIIKNWVATEARQEIIPSKTSPKLAHLIQHCWSKDPAKRPTGDEVVTYLQSPSLSA